jgi:hypothetical protein
MQQTIEGGARYFVFFVFKDDVIGLRMIECIKPKIGIGHGMSEAVYGMVET